MPALPQHIVRCQLYPPSDLRPFQTWAAFLSCRMSFAGVGESTHPSSGLAATTSPKRKKTKCWRAITRPCSDFFLGSIAILEGPRQAEDCRRPRNLIAGAVGPAEKTIGTVDHVAHPCGSFASPFKPPLLLRERDRGAPVFVFPGRLLLLMVGARSASLVTVRACSDSIRWSRHGVAFRVDSAAFLQ